MRGSCGVPGFAAVSPIFSPELPPRPPPRPSTCRPRLPPAPRSQPRTPPRANCPGLPWPAGCPLPTRGRCRLSQFARFAKQAKSDVEHVWHFMECRPFFPGLPGLFPRINFTDLPLGHESYRNFMGLIELNSGTKITFPFTATTSLPYIFPKYSPYSIPEQRGYII